MTTWLELLEGLLHAEEPHQLEAFHAYRIRDASVSIEDLAKTRRELVALVTALEQGTLVGKRSALDATQRSAIDATTPSHTLGSETEREAAAVDQTVTMQPVASDTVVDPRRAGTGTKPSGAIPQNILDLDRYAVLCAWSEIHPERRDAIHAQYGLADEEARQALDAQMQESFRQDGRLRTAFAQRLRMHLTFLRGS